MNESTIKVLLELYEAGKATEQQRQLVEAYLAWHQQQSPKREKDEGNDGSLQEIMEKIRMAREQAAGVEEPASVEEPEEAILYRMEGAGKRKRYAWMAAASIVLIVTVGLLWKQTAHSPGPAPIAITYKTIQAAPGKMIHLLLSDSSEVWLNAGARLRYPQPFDTKMRRLELLDGEAYFQVHPDANRGFVVQTDHLLTRVLGTSFNIKAYQKSQQMNVAVTSGKVAVIPGTERGDQGTILTPGQQVQYNVVSGQLTRTALASDRIMSWKNGTFDFAEESLGDIAIELEHYFNVSIQFKYPGLKKYIFSASFRHTAPLKDILTTLCLLNQNHFTQIDAQHYVIH